MNRQDRLAGRGACLRPGGPCQGHQSLCVVHSHRGKLRAAIVAERKIEEQASYPLGDHCGLSGWRCAGHCVHIDRPKALTVRRLPIGGAHLPAGLNVRSSASRGARRGPHPLQQVANGRRSLFDLDGVRRVAKLGLGREYYDETQSGPTLTVLAPALR